MAEEPVPPYVFRRGRRSIFAEIYFPKKVAYQGAIFQALQEGLIEEKVKNYLGGHIDGLLQELSAYTDLFDPQQYERQRLPRARRSVSREAALERIGMYDSHFKGWSMYEVDGVFLSEERGGIDEERTQVIRLIFSLESSFQEQAIRAGCSDVLEAMIRWSLSDHGRIESTIFWSRQEKERFLSLHAPWPQRKRAFVDQYFESVVKEVKKWIDDTGLFVFGYLVRRFWVQVAMLGGREEEIWVTSFFNLNVNVVQRETL